MKEHIKYRHIIRSVPELVHAGGTTGPGWVCDNIQSIKVGERASFLLEQGIRTNAKVVSVDYDTHVVDTQFAIFTPMDIKMETQFQVHNIHWIDSLWNDVSLEAYNEHMASDVYIGRVFYKLAYHSHHEDIVHD